MDIGIKSGFAKKQLLTTLECNMPFLEFHTFYKDYYSDKVNFKEVKKILEDNNVICHAVHSPMDSKSIFDGDIAIGTFNIDKREKNIDLYKKVIYSASVLCRYKKPVVVAHIGAFCRLNDNRFNSLTNKEVEKYIYMGIEDLIKINDFLVSNYPHIYFAVENMPIFGYDKTGSTIENWKFGRTFDLPELIEKINLSNIKTCLDTCHAQNTINVLNCTSIEDKKLDIIDYIENYKNTLGLMHLNNSIGFGEIAKYHSTPFIKENKNDVEYLYKIINKFNSLNIDAPITLEITESDYTKKPNIKMTLETLKYVQSLL